MRRHPRGTREGGRFARDTRGKTPPTAAGAVISVDEAPASGPDVGYLELDAACADLPDLRARISRVPVLWPKGDYGHIEATVHGQHVRIPLTNGYFTLLHKINPPRHVADVLRAEFHARYVSAVRPDLFDRLVPATPGMHDRNEGLAHGQIYLLPGAERPALLLGSDGAWSVARREQDRETAEPWLRYSQHTRIPGWVWHTAGNDWCLDYAAWDDLEGIERLVSWAERPDELRTLGWMVDQGDRDPWVAR